MNEKKWLVGTENGVFLKYDEFLTTEIVNLTTKIEEATPFEHIGDAMRECIRLNNNELGFTSKFKVIPIYSKEKFLL